MPGNAIAATSALLTPSAVDRMATAARLDAETAQRVVHAGIPAILSGLTVIICRPADVQRLACAIVRQSADPWKDLVEPPEGSALAGRADGDLLVSLLGAPGVAALTSSIGKFIGASEHSTRTLLGLLAPAVIAALGRERRDAGVDALGIAEVIGSQKELIAGAMPADLSSLLRVSGFYDHLGMMSPPPRGTRATRTLLAAHAYWAVLLLAFVGWVLYMLGDAASWRTIGARASLTGQAAQELDGIAAPIPFLTAVRGDWTTAHAYQGRGVYDRRGEKLGTMTDLVIGPDDSIVAVAIDVERSLGIGEKTVAIPFSVLRRSPRRNDGHLVVDVASEQLRSAPAFELLRAPPAEAVAADRLSQRRP